MRTDRHTPSCPLAAVVHTLMNYDYPLMFGGSNVGWFWPLSMHEPLIIIAILLLMCNSLGTMGTMDPGYCDPVYLIEKGAGLF